MIPQQHTTEEVAPMLRVSVRVLREKASAGEIRATKVGRQWLFEETAIADFLSAGSNGATRSRPASRSRKKRRGRAA